MILSAGGGGGSGSGAAGCAKARSLRPRFAAVTAKQPQQQPKLRPRNVVRTAAPPPPLTETRGEGEDNAVEDDSDEQVIWEKGIDADGAGATVVSPDWLTGLQRNWGGSADVPVADAKVEDIKDLLGGALFKALYKWMQESGPVYLLPTGPVSSFLVISDPTAAQHVLRKYTRYGKGLIREVSEFLFGSGFAVAEGQTWIVSRRSVSKGIHQRYLSEMVGKVMVPCSDNMVATLQAAASENRAVDIEKIFSQLTLDIIGKAIFNYDFGALTKDSPVIQAVYTALKETESRATDVFPLWKLPFWSLFSERQRRALAAVDVIRETTESLIERCKTMASTSMEHTGTPSDDPSLLRFLIESREEVSANQLRDDLLSMLVAGHETTASLLTWTIYLLAQKSASASKARAFAEVDSVYEAKADGEQLSFDDLWSKMPFVLRCLCESLRLYPHPPVLIRRALADDTLPTTTGQECSVPAGQDILISVYNIHHSEAVWDDPEEFKPERFDIDSALPNETNTSFRYIPFSGGPRKCVGDQFALLEATAAMASLLRNFDFELVPNREIGLTTGATIHTTNGMYINLKRRDAGTG